jgi:hypothetical protein
MNKKCRLIKSLLDGETINVSNSIRLTSLSNPAREIPRCIEEPFGVTVTKTKMENKDKHGNYATWHNYKLERLLPENVLGVEKMRLYLAENMGEYRPKEKEPMQEISKDLFAEL